MNMHLFNTLIHKLRDEEFHYGFSVLVFTYLGLIWGIQVNDFVGASLMLFGATSVAFMAKHLDLALGLFGGLVCALGIGFSFQSLLVFCIAWYLMFFVLGLIGKNTPTYVPRDASGLS